MNAKNADVRINKYLAHLGMASRRQIDTWILRGKVKLNGQVITKPGIKINPAKDKLEIAGKPLVTKQKLIYLALNKPVGYMTTTQDPFASQTVFDLIHIPQRVYPVGRLDQNSRGLMLFTNDGSLTYRLTHPKFHVPKTYAVTLLGMTPESKLEIMRRGVKLEDSITAPAQVKKISTSARSTVIHIILTEGKKRQIRRMAAALRLYVLDLKRVAIGPLQLGELKEGKWRYLTPVEIISLKRQAHLK